MSGPTTEGRPPLKVATKPVYGDPYAVAEVTVTHGEDCLVLTDYEAWQLVDVAVDALQNEEK